MARYTLNESVVSDLQGNALTCHTPKRLFGRYRWRTASPLFLVCCYFIVCLHTQKPRQLRPHRWVSRICWANSFFFMSVPVAALLCWPLVFELQLVIRLRSVIFGAGWDGAIPMYSLSIQRMRRLMSIASESIVKTRRMRLTLMRLTAIEPKSFSEAQRINGATIAPMILWRRRIGTLWPSICKEFAISRASSKLLKL